ncbi:MAG: nuclear transport factor 2 family protein [Planctomycetota bacterium]
MSRPHGRAVRSLALLLALTAFAACASSSEGSARESARAANEDRLVDEEVKEFLRHYIRTLEGRDEPAVRALFVDDGRFAWFTDGVEAYGSPDDVLVGMRRYAAMTFHTELADEKVLPLRDGLAAASSRFRTRLEIPGSPDFEYGGVISWLLENEDGRWRVLRGHTSTPGGPPRDETSDAYGGPVDAAAP